MSAKVISIDGKAGRKAREKREASKRAAVKRKWDQALALREMLRARAV